MFEVKSVDVTVQELLETGEVRSLVVDLTPVLYKAVGAVMNSFRMSKPEAVNLAKHVFGWASRLPSSILTSLQSEQVSLAVDDIATYRLTTIPEFMQFFLNIRDSCRRACQQEPGVSQN